MENTKKEIISIAGLVSSRFSLSPIAGQIYALLYLSSRPVSLNDMVKELRISKGSASTNIRALESWGAVRKVWVNSDRRDYYEANPDIEGIVLRRVKEGIKKRIGEIKPKVESIESALKNGKKSKDLKFVAGRFAKLKKILSFAENAVDILPERADFGKLSLIGKIAKLAK